MLHRGISEVRHSRAGLLTSPAGREARRKMPPGAVASAGRRETEPTGAADRIWQAPNPSSCTQPIGQERNRPRGSRWLDRPCLATKETGPEPRIFPIKEPFFSDSAGNKMTVARVL